MAVMDAIVLVGGKGRDAVGSGKGEEGIKGREQKEGAFDFESCSNFESKLSLKVVFVSFI